MAKANPDKLGTSRPKIKPDDLEDEVALVTVATYDDPEVEDSESESGTRYAPYLTFEELGDKVLWLNKTQMVTMIEKMGDETDNWIGAIIPIEAVKKSFGTKTFHKVVVMEDPNEWDQYDWSKPRRRSKTAKTAKKTTKRKSTKKKSTRGRG